MDGLLSALIANPTDILAVGVVMLVGWLGLLILRSPLVVRLGLRNIPRRRSRALLIVLGLTMSTTVVGSAFGTGDSMSSTVESVVTESLGTVDEVIVFNALRQDRATQIRTLTEPGLASVAAANPRFFGDERYDAVSDSVANSDSIAGIVPAIIDQVTVVNSGSQQVRAGMLVVAVPRTLPSAFGPLVDRDGVPAEMESLPPDSIVLNEAAASSLDVEIGQSIELTIGSLSSVANRTTTPWRLRVDAIVEDEGIVGAQAALILPLDIYQAVLVRQGEINIILVANAGGSQSVDNTEDALIALRSELVNTDVAVRLHEFLKDENVTRGMADAATRLDGRDRDRLIELREEASLDSPTGRFNSLVSDPLVRNGLAFLARDYLPASERREVYGLLRNVSTHTVVPLKQQGVERAEEYGTIVTTVFLVLGLFSIGASIMLIVLTFSLLAADRVSELATMRALGMTNRQVMGTFLVEGVAYALAGALSGALAGIAIGKLTTTSLAAALTEFGFALQHSIDARTVLISFASGLLLTVSAILVSAWRASRVGIVAATRGEQEDQSIGWRLVVGTGLLLAAAIVWLRWREPMFVYELRHPIVLPGALSLALLGAGLLASVGVRRFRVLSDALPIVIGATLSIIWGRALAGLPTERGDLTSDAVVIGVGGLCFMVATTLTLARALGPFMRGIDAALSPLGHIRAVVRPVGGQLSRHRWRGGMTVVMFGLVIFVMTTSLTMIDALLAAYADDRAPVAGFQLRLDQRGNEAITNLQTVLDDSDAIAADSIESIGGLSSIDVQAVDLGRLESRWLAASMIVADDGFLGTIEARLNRQVSGLDDSRDAWTTIRDQPGTAIVTADLLVDRSDPGSADGSDTLSPRTIWVRPGNVALSVGSPISLEIVGVIDARADLSSDIYTSVESASELGVAIPAPERWYVSTPTGVRLADVEAGLQVAFVDQGIQVVNLGDAQRISQTIRTLLTRIVQVFMGVGLVAGIVALGLLGVQNVIERRQQLGTLRALGFTRRQTGMTLALESAVIAIAGIATGVAMGVFLSRTLVGVLAADYPEIRLSIPWQQITLLTAVAWSGSTLAIILAAFQAARVSPSAALRID